MILKKTIKTIQEPKSILPNLYRLYVYELLRVDIHCTGKIQSSDTKIFSGISTWRFVVASLINVADLCMHQVRPCTRGSTFQKD